MALIKNRRLNQYTRTSLPRLKRILAMYEAEMPVIEIARLEHVTRQRIYQLVDLALKRREEGLI